MDYCKFLSALRGDLMGKKLAMPPAPHPPPPPASGHFYGLSGEPEGTHPRTSPQDRMGRTRQELSRSNGK